MSAFAGLAGGAAGAYLGSFFGPIGTAIGWAIGSLVGNLLFPQRTEGPKLENLKLQVSSYGIVKPIVYGSMRIAGNVIDASDLKPHSHSSGGKGGSSSTTTTYSADICVLLTGCEIVDVTRCWALGETIWPNGNDPCPFTIYKGTQTQLPDPTFEVLHGVGEVPAYRGRAYVVFEDFDLERYGNSIPQFNFEVITSAGHIPWRVSTWAPPRDLVGSGAGFAVAGASMGTDGTITIGVYTQLDGVGTTTQSYAEYTFDTDGNQLSTEGPLTMTNQPSAIGDNTRMASIPVANAQISFCKLAQQGGDAYASSWYVRDALVAWPVAPAIGTDAAYAVTQSSQPFFYAAADPLNSCVYAVGGSSGAGYWVARYPAPNGIPQGGVDVYYAFTTAPGIYQITVSDDGFIYALGPAAGTGHTWALAKFDLDLNLIYQWNDGDLPVTATGPVFQFTVYSGMIFWTTGAGDADLYSLNSDHTFTLVGTTPVAVASPAAYPLITFGNGLVLSRDGVLSLIPPPAGTTYGAVVADISARCDLLSSQVDVTAIPEPLDGFVINQQQPARDSILPLQSADYFDMVESSGIMKCVKRGGAPVVSIPDDDLAATTNPDEAPPLSVYKRIKEADLPATLNVKYINAANDYEVGQQSERRQVTSSEQTRTIELTISLSDAKARQVAKALIYSAWFEREPETLRTSRKYAYLEPTDVVTARGGEIRIMQKSDEASNVVQFDGVPSIANIWTSSPIAGSGTGFRPTHPPTSQSTQLLLLDIPLVTDADTPGFYAAMAGAVDNTWRGANLYQSIDGGVTWNSIATSSTPSVIGTCSNALTVFTSNIFDEGSVLHVVIGNGGGTLASTTATAALAGNNSCLIGNEIASFKNATLTAPGEYDLSGWLRGRRGTEAFTGAHVVGERFVMLPVTDVAMPNAQLYHTYSYRAVTFGRPLAGTIGQDFANTGNSLKCYSPTDVGGGCDASGNVTLNCKRRTRIGGAWVDYTDVPLSESVESYVWQICDSSYTVCGLSVTTSTPTCPISAAQQTTVFGAVQHDVFFTVAQVGSFGLGAQTRGSAPSTGASNVVPLVPIPWNVTPPLIPPPGPSAAVDIAMTWPEFHLRLPMTIGQRKVCSFTTGGSVPLTGTIEVSEAASAGTGRRCFIATDTGGLNIVPRSLSYGTTATSFIGSAAGGAILAAATTYYYIFDFVQPDGTLSGPPGFNADTFLNLGNVT